MSRPKLVVTGVVRDGIVAPEGELPLPNGTRVDIVFPPAYEELPQEFWDEIALWDRASAEALELVERTVQKIAACRLAFDKSFR